MKMNDFVRVLRKRWIIVLLVPVIAVVSAYAFSITQTPLYRSRAEYSVGINRLDSGAAIFVSQTFNHYRNLVYNPDQLHSISQDLSLDQSGSSLMDYVRVQPQPNDLRFVIEVDYFNPKDAQRLALAVGERLNAIVVEENRNLQGQDRLSLRRVLTPQEGYKAKPNTKINMLAGALLGLVVGMVLAFVLDYLDDTVRNAADVERYTGLPTIGAIPGGATGAGRRPRFRPATAVGVIAAATHSREDYER